MRIFSFLCNDINPIDSLMRDRVHRLFHSSQKTMASKLYSSVGTSISCYTNYLLSIKTIQLQVSHTALYQTYHPLSEKVGVCFSLLCITNQDATYPTTNVHFQVIGRSARRTWYCSFFFATTWVYAVLPACLQHAAQPARLHWAAFSHQKDEIQEESKTAKWFGLYHTETLISEA